MAHEEYCDDAVLDAAAAAAALRVSRRTLVRQRRNGGLPCHAVGARRLYLLGELVGWLRSRPDAPGRRRTAAGEKRRRKGNDR